MLCNVLPPSFPIVDRCIAPSSEITVKLIRSTKSIYVNHPLPFALLYKLVYVLELHIRAFINHNFKYSILRSTKVPY